MADAEKPRLLIVDDEQPVLNALHRSLRDRFETVLSLSGPAALQVLREQEVAVILADQRMPEMTGVEFFKKARALRPDAVRVMLTGYSDITAIVDAVNEGRIFYYLQKPWEPDELRLLLEQAADKYHYRLENRRLTRELEMVNQRLREENVVLRQAVEQNYVFDNIVGSSPAIEQVFALMKKIIPTDSTVLITGETGTGKELVAQAIHYNGPRRERLFLAQNCAALPDTLLESILFGHKKGAFTDAVSDRRGLFELADGGTIFLDELADTSPAFQQRLLRVLQEGEIRPVGAADTIKVDVRIVASSNRDLQAAVRRGEFREDLYYRLNVFPIHLPPLRERRPDIPLLARHFVEKYACKLGKCLRGLSAAAEEELSRREYPGNIRELENLIERTVILADDGDLITPELLAPAGEREPAASVSPAPPDSRLDTAVAALEQRYIRAALERNGGNVSQAARELGLSRAGLYQKMRRYAIDSSTPTGQ